jgi:4-alpha-glucanotransferase
MRNATPATSFRLDRRAAGILLHPTSLPGPFGSGDLGAEAYAFVDFLHAAGCRWWQMLPTGPIGPANSPYASTSAFAGNVLLIDPRRLAKAGLLKRSELRTPTGVSAGRVRFNVVIPHRMRLLRQAFERFAAAGGLSDREFRRFCDAQAAWLDDFALFSALKTANRGKAWPAWPAAQRDRQPAALRAAAADLRTEIDFHRFTQFEFYRQWNALRTYAHDRGIGLIGDIPIFNAMDAADVWAKRELYAIDREGRAKAVTGCPPDFFSKDGQLWGHPQYDWKKHEATQFAWWTARFRHLLTHFDAARIDHFLGFHRVWWLPGDAKTARHGRYVKSPGDALFTAVTRALGPVNIIAEDLGAVTPEAFALRDKFSFPGMRTMMVGFGSDDPGAHYHLPHTYVPNCVAYTGTHDNDTVVGWYRKLRRQGTYDRRRRQITEFGRVERYLGPTDREIHWRMIRALYASVANLVVIPMQDVLGLDSRHRMNTPATVRNNWEWRMTENALDDAVADRLQNLRLAYLR